MSEKLPHVPMSHDEWSALDPAQRREFALAIAADRDAGLSGREIREKYDAEWGYNANPTGSKSFLSGPRRRELLRSVKREDLIADSYERYRDGQPRKGSGHAGTHGLGG